MSFDDFCKCTLDELGDICNAWNEMQENRHRDAWERARTVAAIVIQPHVKKRMIPQQLMPLPWDKKKSTAPQGNAPRLTADQQRRRLEELARRLGDEVIG